MRYDELQDEIKNAMRAKDKPKLSILRQVHGEIKNIEVNERRDITDADVDAMLKRLIKQTKETLDGSIKAGNDQERTDTLTAQVAILESYLPKQVSGDELAALIDEVLTETGASSKKDMGRVMGALTQKTGGNFDKAAAAKEKKKKLDEIAARRKEKMTARLLEQKEREEARLTARRLKAESKLKARQARATRKGRMIQIDSTALRELDSLIVLNMAEQDSLLNLLVDSLLTDTAAMAVPADSIDSLAAPRDSIYRLLKGFRNVKIYRSDFQTVCDSMTAISTDSTIHLYIDPVLWNENNQITSDVMDIFTENQQLTRAEFIGSPMMVSQLDTMHYNQVAGKTMTAYFFNNQIYRNDVNGNAQTIYYMQDGEPVEITMMGVIESGEISFFIEDKQVVQITYRGDPVYNFYPMDKIPPTQDIRLKGFKWEGARRPSQAEVFDRRIRPSERERRSEMKHPDFPIMQRIDEHRKRLIEQRRWTDRNDQVDAATVEWMHSLGYEVGQPRKTEAPAE